MQPADRHGCGGIAEVVPSGQGQAELAHGQPLLVEGGEGAVAAQIVGYRGEVDPVRTGGGPPVPGLEVLPQDRTVPVGQQFAAAMCKPLKRGDQGVQVGVVIGVIQLQVGDHPKPGLELHQRAVGFIRLGDQ